MLGPDHPDVLTTRDNIAAWTGQCGDAAAALRLFRELLPDQVRVLGPDHPDVLTTRDNIASWTGECGDAAAALRLFRELLPDRVRVLGPDHPDVLTTRGNIAAWTGECGDAAAALRLFRELLPDQVRVLGPDHPDVLTTRGNIAAWTARSGGDAGHEPGADPDAQRGRARPADRETSARRSANTALTCPKVTVNGTALRRLAAYLPRSSSQSARHLRHLSSGLPAD